jgi:uncharacterized protein
LNDFNEIYLMEYLIIAITVLFGAMLTFFSGFGLGTLLLPVFGIFFPLDIAVAMTAIVHFSNNIFKFGLVYKHIHVKTLLSFGIPAMFAAWLGSKLLLNMETHHVLHAYSFHSKTFEITSLGLVIGSLMIFFALLEFSKQFNQLEINAKYIPFGGLLSGFFGGISGHQGAFRAAFLSKSGLDKNQFVGTSNAISLIIDCTRLFTYSALLQKTDLSNSYPLLSTAILCGIIGTLVGKQLIKKVTITKIQRIVGVLLFIMGGLIALGLI